jgi:hypothetical protein
MVYVLLYCIPAVVSSDSTIHDGAVTDIALVLVAVATFQDCTAEEPAQ